MNCSKCKINDIVTLDHKLTHNFLGINYHWNRDEEYFEVFWAVVNVLFKLHFAACKIAYDCCHDVFWYQNPCKALWAVWELNQDSNISSSREYREASDTLRQLFYCSAGKMSFVPITTHHTVCLWYYAVYTQHTWYTEYLQYLFMEVAKSHN